MDCGRRVMKSTLKTPTVPWTVDGENAAQAELRVMEDVHNEQHAGKEYGRPR